MSPPQVIQLFPSFCLYHFHFLLHELGKKSFGGVLENIFEKEFVKTIFFF